MGEEESTNGKIEGKYIAGVVKEEDRKCIEANKGKANVTPGEAKWHLIRQGRGEMEKRDCRKQKDKTRQNMIWWMRTRRCVAIWDKEMRGDGTWGKDGRPHKVKDKLRGDNMIKMTTAKLKKLHFTTLIAVLCCLLFLFPLICLLWYRSAWETCKVCRKRWLKPCEMRQALESAFHVSKSPNL